MFKTAESLKENETFLGCMDNMFYKRGNWIYVNVDVEVEITKRKLDVLPEVYMKNL